MNEEKIIEKTNEIERAVAKMRCFAIVLFMGWVLAALILFAHLGLID